MKYLPYENFYVTTLLTPAKVVERLKKEVEPDTGISFKKMFFRSSEYYFTGYIGYEKFELEPVISYRNSFLPQIKGIIKPHLNGSRIQVVMRLHTGVVVFMGIWMGFVMLLGCAFLLKSFITAEFTLTTLIPLGMMLFAYCLALGGFKYESIDAKNKLNQIFEGSIT
jgi:hypothetical protein